jgi:hypothetical protein
MKKGTKEIKTDLVNHPPHYTSTQIEVLDVIDDYLISTYGIDGIKAHYVSVVLKYLLRYGKKEGTNTDDIGKALFYVSRMLSHIEGREPKAIISIVKKGIERDKIKLDDILKELLP